MKTFEPPHGKTNNLHRRKKKMQISFAETAKLISAFVFATRIVQFFFYLIPKFQASSSFLLLCRLVCVGPVRKPHCLFFHEMAHFMIQIPYLALKRCFENCDHLKRFTCKKTALLTKTNQKKMIRIISKF